MSKSESNDNRPASGLQIVLVDDSRLWREHVVISIRSIRGVGEIRQASDVASGIQLLENRPADVLVIDIEMPGPDGMELLTFARKGKFAKTILMFSFQDDAKLRQKCMELGADYYFHKLHDFERLAEVCEDLAKNRSSLGESSSTSAND